MTKLFFLILILILIIIIFYGTYYFINPSQRGEEILRERKIPYPTIIAHRGASIIAPESTVPAFELGRQTGADYLEADLQLTSDGEVVIIHDPTLNRTSNVEEVFPERESYQVNEFTLEELKQLDFGSWFNETYPERASEEYEGLEIVTLDKLISIAEEGENDPGLMLEFKHPYNHPGLEEKTVEVLERRGWLNEDNYLTADQIKEKENTNDRVKVGKGPARLIFMSFDLNSLRTTRDLVPEFSRILLITDNMITRRSWSRWLETAEELVDGIGAKGFMAWPWHIASAHERELFVFPYTINHLWQIKVLSRFSADGFITDRPYIVAEFLDRSFPLLPMEYGVEEIQEESAN